MFNESRFSEKVEEVHKDDSPAIQSDPVVDISFRVKKEEWTEAMKNEIDSLKKNDVWDLVELPKGRKAIGCKWIYKTKLDADGEIERYKVRLVAQGCNQKYGIDYDETPSPVVRFKSICTVIALAASFGLKLHQMDVKTAFLNGELKEEIFISNQKVLL